jgi:hypothetical protein
MADYSLTNDGTLQELHRRVEDLAARAGLLTTG